MLNRLSHKVTKMSPFQLTSSREPAEIQFQVMMTNSFFLFFF